MNILIAEDDPASRRLLEATLVKWEYDVVTCSDGDEVWQAFQQKDAPQIAILDWMMPGLDGIEVCRKVRQMPEPRLVYILLLTAKGRREDILEGLGAGADDYLVKPSSVDCPAQVRHTVKKDPLYDRWPDLVMRLAGGCAAVLGLTVMGGWHVGNLTLIQVMPMFAPMQYNTALCFSLCGAGLLATALGRSRAAMIGGGIALALGFLTLLQYIFDVSLGLDQLLMRAYVTVQTSHPGRMSPLTASSFTLAGAALLWND